MALTITATPVPELWAIRLDATGQTGTVSWFRDEGARSIPVATGATVYDYEAPLNTPLVYTATDDLDAAEADPAQVDSDAPILSRTTEPVATRCQVVSYRPLLWEGRSSWHRVLGASLPYVSVAETTSPSGTVRFRTTDAEGRLRLIEILTAGDPLLLRTTDAARLDTLRFVVTEVSDPFPTDTMRQGATHFEVGFQTVAPVRRQYVAAGWNYDALQAAHATYDDVQAAYPSYTAVLAGPA